MRGMESMENRESTGGMESRASVEIALPDDPTTRPFFDGCVRRELWLQRCSGCGHHQIYPRPHCLACGVPDPPWVMAAGTATVYSKTRVERSVRADLAAPYVVALVALDEGPRMLTLLDDEELAIGSAVRVAWRDRTGLPPLPVFVGC
jgi:uncharacterized OB-fold protein